jgi:hypothetical protein
MTNSPQLTESGMNAQRAVAFRRMRDFGKLSASPPEPVFDRPPDLAFEISPAY